MIGMIIVMVIVSGLSAGVMFFMISQVKVSVRGSLGKLEEELAQKKGYYQEIVDTYKQMVNIPEMKIKVDEYLELQESLKAERGRITITQAELETVEARLRELEEIERELEASNIETKEELNILKKKEKELASKNENLKSQLQQSIAQMDTLVGELELSAQMQEQVDNMRGELLATEERVSTLLLQIEQGNEQYFILKTRYDALDIEYAQLYEKFSEAEAMVSGSSE